MFRLAAPLLVTASALNDETSLMQGMKPTRVAQPVDKSKSIANLLSTATSMLKNGETADVVAFASATLEEIRAEVLPAINRQHDADQEFVYQTHAQFEIVLLNLEADNREIKELSDIERGLSAQHRVCRAEEEVICGVKRQCDYDLYDRWLRFVDEEYELRRLSKEIEDHWCPPVPEPRPGPLDPNGTTWAFRNHAVTLFPPWRIQKPIVETHEYEYSEKVPECEELYNRLNAKTDECDGIQARLEMAACAHATRVQQARIRFFEDWTWHVRNYQNVVDEVHCLEIDRWKEWRTLETVECLLNRTTDRNGRPCEEATDEITTEVAHCEQVHYDVNIDHLIIIYPPVPPYPPLCEITPWELSYHPGRCVPRIPETPCSNGWAEQEYNDLWEVPQPLFHHENSHCNQRPPCQECLILPTPIECIDGFHYFETHPEMTFVWIPDGGSGDVCHSATRAQLAENYWESINTGNGGMPPNYRTAGMTAEQLEQEALGVAGWLD